MREGKFRSGLTKLLFYSSKEELHTVSCCTQLSWGLNPARGSAATRQGSLSLPHDNAELNTTKHTLSTHTDNEAMGTTWKTRGSAWTSGNTFYCEADWALEQVAQGSFGVPILGDIQKPSDSPGQTSLGDPAWAGQEVDQMTFRGPFQPQPFCDSVFLWRYLVPPRAGRGSDQCLSDKANVSVLTP